MNTYLFRNALTIFAFLLFICLGVNAQSNWKKSVIKYIEKNLSKADGGYGWEDQPDSHLTPTFAVIGILNDLDNLPANKQELIQFIKTHHPQRGKNIEAGPSGTEMRDLTYQQIKSIQWLDDGDASAFKEEVINWKPQFNKVSNFEEHGYPVFLQEMMTPICRSLLGISIDDVSEHFKEYLQARRREDGSFNNTPSSEGGDGNIINTYWGLYGRQQLYNEDEMSGKTVDWINSCQLKNGGFTHQPKATIGGNDDVAYTWAAVKALELMAKEPQHKEACVQYLISLHNADGGFGNRPGLSSTPMSTFYAIDALKSLHAFSNIDAAHFIDPTVNKPTDFSGYKIFTVEFEASGVGSPAEAVMLADSMHINLWGTKNSTEAWRTTAQKIADEKKVPVIFFQSDEAYGKAVTVKGLGTFSHIMDYIAPPHANKKLELDGSSWQAYNQTFIEPLLKNDGALILQITNNEPLGRMILDESLAKGGFAAISTIHFGQNFSFWLPWLWQYRYRFPFIALQDAHGTESWWWGNELAGYRTLFLGKTGSYEEMMDALKNNWVVAVRHDSISDYKTRILGGAEGVQSYIISKMNSWKWWTNDTSALNHPWAAITLITQTDSFEVAHPATGVNLRIRRSWNSIRQLLKEPAVVLENLKIDDAEVKPEYKEIKNKRGGIDDSYYLYAMKQLTKGKHTIEATFRNVRNNEVRKMHKKFSYNNDRVVE